MGKVRLEFFSWVGDTLDIAGNSNKVIMEAQTGENNTVRDLLSELAMKYPRFGQNIFDVKMRKLNERVSIFLNGALLIPGNGLEIKLNDGNILTFLPMIEGG